MGMSIDKHMENLLDMMDSMPDDACGDWRDSLAYAIDTMRKYQQLQIDYENRLKADMVAMLTDIQLEIEELRLDRPLMSRGYECYGFENKTPTEIKKECSDIIQQKINSLEEQTDGKDNS